MLIHSKLNLFLFWKSLVLLIEPLYNQFSNKEKKCVNLDSFNIYSIVEKIGLSKSFQEKLSLQYKSFIRERERNIK